MILKYSVTGIPYIEFEDKSRLSFSILTKHPEKGFKYLCFSGVDTASVCVSAGKTKNKKYKKISENVNFSTNMEFASIPRNAKKTLTPMTIGYLKKLFKTLTIEEYFPELNLKTLENALNSINDKSDECDDDETATESYDDLVDLKFKIGKPKKRKMNIKPKAFEGKPRSFERV